MPATVVMIPAGLTMRTRLLPVSAMYTSPAASTARPAGSFAPHWGRRAALVARPPSPENPNWPLPAIVAIVPSGLITRTRAFAQSKT